MFMWKYISCNLINGDCSLGRVLNFAILRVWSIIFDSVYTFNFILVQLLEQRCRGSCFFAKFEACKHRKFINDAYFEIGDDNLSEYYIII